MNLNSIRAGKQRPQQQKRRDRRSGAWLPAEDACLRAAVAEHGSRWVLVAGKVETRNADQCAKRWNEKLNPELDHGPWTAEEDERLLSMVGMYGREWKLIANSSFETRASLALKNRHSLLLRRLKREGIRIVRNQEYQRHPDLPSIGYGVKTREERGPSLPLIDSVPVSVAGSLDPMSLSSGASGLSSHHPVYQATDISSTSPCPITAIPFTSGMEYASPESSTANGRQEEGIPSRPLTPAGPRTKATWKDRSPVWHRKSSLSGDGVELDGGAQSGIKAVEKGHEAERIIPTASSNARSRHSHWGNDHNRKASNDGSQWENWLSGVEYAATCRRGTLKAQVNRLLDTAMAESAWWAANEDQVTVALKLKL